VHDVVKSLTYSDRRKSATKHSLGSFTQSKDLFDGGLGIIRFAPGSSFTGEEAWAAGNFAVLSGVASVVGVVEAGGEDVVLATLCKGSVYGWSEDQMSTAEFAMWEGLQPRIVVGSEHALRVYRLPKCRPVRSKFHMGQEENGLDDMTRRLAELWLTTSAPPVGIRSQPGGLLRAHFFAGLWGPMLDRLEDHEDEIRRRIRRGYRKHDCFPLQGHQIAELRDHILHLTEIWYGTTCGGNLSSFYRWFMKAMDTLGVTAYSFSAIPVEHSPDGWTVVVDGAARRDALKGKKSTDASYVAAGGISQAQGRSAIDNTTLVNVFTALEARVLLVGRRLRKTVCRFIALRQTCILRRLSVQLKVNLEGRAREDSTGRSHRVVRAVLRALSSEDLSSIGIDPEESFCFRVLRARGSVLAGFGQLELADQQVVWEKMRNELLPTGVEAGWISPHPGSQDVFDRLVLWCRDRPGEYFETDRLRHFLVLVSGIWAGKIVLVKRSAMERMTLARYFALSWRRSQPLWACLRGEPAILRAAGMLEASRVRVNECPYAKLHGMSLPNSGFAFDQRRQTGKKQLKGYSLMMEMQWVNDPASNVENWFITDIEKILSESWHLNPHGPRSTMLPGEMFVNVGQNPKIGSSIKATQHTQLCEGSLSSYPLLQLSSSAGPRSSKALDAAVDLIAVGPAEADSAECGFLLKIVTTRPTEPALVRFLVDLRLRLLENFGGAEALDFLVTSVGDENGGFVVLFAPIPQLEKIGSEPPDLAAWANPLTGESSEIVGLEEARIDFGKGVGQFLCLKPALREQLLSNGEDTLRRIWAFNRVPGVHDAVASFVEEQRIFE